MRFLYLHSPDLSTSQAVSGPAHGTTYTVSGSVSPHIAMSDNLASGDAFPISAGSVGGEQSQVRDAIANKTGAPNIYELIGPPIIADANGVRSQEATTRHWTERYREHAMRVVGETAHVTNAVVQPTISAVAHMLGIAGAGIVNGVIDAGRSFLVGIHILENPKKSK